MTPYLTIPEVARILRVDVKTVREDIRAGRLRAVRVGARGQFRVPPDALPDLPSAVLAETEEKVAAIRKPRRERATKVPKGRFR